MNALSDSELVFEIEQGRNSRFEKTMIPVLKLAYKLRSDAIEENRRNEELQIGRDSNQIAMSALEEAKKANKKSDQARIWPGLAILVSVIIACISWWGDR